MFIPLVFRLTQLFHSVKSLLTNHNKELVVKDKTPANLQVVAFQIEWKEAAPWALSHAAKLTCPSAASSLTFPQRQLKNKETMLLEQLLYL